MKADLQALIPQDIASISGNVNGACNGTLADGSLGIAVVVYPTDSDLTLYNNSVGTKNPISGIGDKAYWNIRNFNPGNMDAPALFAHKGTVTCVLESHAAPKTTMKTTPDASGGYTVTPSDELAYVQS